MRIRLAKSFSFEAAHFLPSFPEGHKCRRMHGHSFRVDIVVEGPLDPVRGYLVDYGDIKRAVAPLHDELDHRLLNDLHPVLPMLAEVIVHETCTSRCEYRGPST
jgi:6-pyruvoyltetrahydropterin/6-carboxytetrahydropterin synthase